MPTLLKRALQTALTEMGDIPGPGGCPSPCHLLSCVQIVAGYGGNEDLQAAAVLHEIIEVACWTVDRVEEEFGQHVALLVAAVSEDCRLPWSPRSRKSATWPPAAIRPLVPS